MNIHNIRYHLTIRIKCDPPMIHQGTYDDPVDLDAAISASVSFFTDAGLGDLLEVSITAEAVPD